MTTELSGAIAERDHCVFDNVAPYLANATVKERFIRFLPFPLRALGTGVANLRFFDAGSHSGWLGLARLGAGGRRSDAGRGRCWVRPGDCIQPVIKLLFAEGSA